MLPTPEIYFSIIMPTYNRAHFLPGVIDSVLNQTFANWELILIDNHSTDSTNDFLESITDRRVKILKIDNGGSISASRNLGLIKSSGQWLAYLDSDDLWEPQKLERCYSYTEKEFDFIYHDMHILSEGLADQKLTSRQVRTPVLRDLLLFGNTIVTSSVVARRDVISDIGFMDERTELQKSGDFHSWLRVSEVTDRFIHIPDLLGSYRIHESNISNLDIFESTWSAIEPFIYHLNIKEQKIVERNLVIEQIRIYINSGFLRSGLRFTPKALAVGTYLLKLNTLLRIIQILIRKTLAPKRN
ncbi:WcaA Glycosyltransferases involved in cell wall biogenesis [Candidatus Nanopelagicaceae bacterium]